MRRLIVLLVGLGISAVSLYFALRGFDFGGVWSAAMQVQLGWFALMIVPFVLTFMSKVWRWRVMFHPDEQRVSNGLLFSALMISYIPLPFRAGEVARGLITSSRSGIPAARVFSTILVEKVLDVLTLLLFLGVSLPFVELPPEMQGPAVTVAIGVTVATLLLLALVLKPDIGRGLARFVARMLPVRFGERIESATEHVLEGFAPMSSPPVALRIVGWSIGTWGINVVTVYLMLRAFNIEVSPLAAAVLVVVTNLSMAVPAAPGSIGTFEFAVVTVLGAMHIGLETRQSFALLYHFIGLAPVALMGVIAWVQQGISLGSLNNRAAVAPAPVATSTAREKR
jgi:glycosyltransferase 2 family protein